MSPWWVPGNLDRPRGSKNSRACARKLTMEPLVPEIACFETAPEIVPSMPQALACAPDAFKEHRKHRSLFANGSSAAGRSFNARRDLRHRTHRGVPPHGNPLRVPRKYPVLNAGGSAYACRRCFTSDSAGIQNENFGLRESLSRSRRVDRPATDTDRAGARSKHLQRDDRGATDQSQRIRAFSPR